jgi:hypothetical protein
MSLIHGYLTGGDMSKIMRDGEVLVSSDTVEVDSPYGIIRLQTSIWLKTEFAAGRLVVCDASIKEGVVPVGEPLTTP